MTTSATDLVRLHITPFNATIYEKNIPQSIRNTHPNVSFHAIQTFPERGFGYLETSKTDAEAIKRKLNGSILKGVKIRIEEARPMKRKSEVVEDETVEVLKKRSKKPKVEKKARNPVLPGYELSADRSVKRGWTDDKAVNKKSKKTGGKLDREKAKTLFKTVVPPNLKSTEKEKSKKSGVKTDKKKKTKDEVVVKEFDRSRSTFAVSSASSTSQKLAVEYRDGVGWLDEDGDVVEAETARSKRRRGQAVPVKQPAPVVAEAEAESESEDDDQSMESDEDGETRGETPQATTAPTEDESESAAEDDDPDSSSQSEVEIKDTIQETAIIVKEVHPLEALYKRSKAEPKELAPIDTSFSFFNAQADAEDAVEDASVLPPQTPHTKQDLDWRRQRSAAPTPDTAAIDGRFEFPMPSSDEEEEDDEDEMPTPLQQTTKPTDSAVEVGEQESDFRKFFFEHRGESDRAWKKRRREAKKLERQRENRRLARRIV